MAELCLPQPSEKQKLFLRDRHKYVGYGGARGGGKSWAVRVKAVLLCLRYPGIKVMIVRKTYPELQENHIVPLCQMLGCYLDAEERIAVYNDGKKQIAFPNGSRILFRYLENEKDALRFQGTEIDVLFVDEATQQSEERMDKLRACVRGVNNFPKRIYYTMNPGGEGHEWVRRLFIDRRFKPSEDPEEYSFIQSLVTDNKALMKSDPDYIKQLESLPPKLRKAWLEGRWDIFEGQFFEDFRIEPDVTAAVEAGVEEDKDQLLKERRWTHVIEPFDIPDGWKIYRSFDWGYNKPFSVGWWAVDYDGVVYRILELYGCTDTPNEGVKWIPEQVFGKIQQIEHEHRWLRGKRIYGVADPAIWDAQYGQSIAETAMKYGIFFDKGDHERLPGWMQVHYRFMFDQQGFPMMYVFSNCKAFIRTIPTLMYDEHKPEDLDTDGEDHVADEVRYFLMSRPIEPIPEPVPDEYDESVLKTVFEIEREDLVTRTPRPRMEIIRDAENV